MASQEYEESRKTFAWGQKEALKKRLEEFSVSHPDVKHIRILLAGQTGAGKSSFINSVNNVFQGRMTSEALVDSNDLCFTKRLKSHRVRGAGGDLPFVLIDTMGLEPCVLEGPYPEDIIQAIYGHVKENYKFNPDEPLSHRSKDYISDPLLSEQAFCLVYIVDAPTIQYIDERLTDKLKIIRQRIGSKRIPLMIVMTKVDEACPLVNADLRKLYTSEKIRKMKICCAERIGVPISSIYPVKNYHDEIEVDDDVDVLILNAFEQIVNSANDRLREEAYE
ncbi:interferon-induced protein 44-like [Puntigrus tetrazona]|uniref:interferon-induced protein 44-like n=1 Tax=Puntigrus tetrazona TaxID=1606681 RepID=UPI001C8AC19F|nr:interferon-induced protein 44-like [Puntigrus tetrazona]